MKNEIQAEIERIKTKLVKDQSADGTWNYPFESGLTMDAYMIILLRTLEINDEQLIRGLVERIMSKQEPDGTWKLFHDKDHGNLTTTVECYYALLYSGYVKKDSVELQAARRQILAFGGIENIHDFSKTLLALTGQYTWPRFFPIPIEAILLPLSFPLNFYDLAMYGRVHITPVLIVADKKFSLQTNKSPNLSDLYLSSERVYDNDHFSWSRSEEWRSILSLIEDGLKNLVGDPLAIHSLAMKQAEKYMLDRIEPDGTFYSYFSSTFLMIFALLSLGYPKDHVIIKNAVKGLKSMICIVDRKPHIQFSTATVWNTALISYALHDAGISPKEAVMQKATHYILSRQHTRYGDWVIHNPKSLPGGWGFSNINTMNPDIDDTTASLRAIYGLATTDPSYRQAWDRGVHWLLSMQNDDGGWAAFEKNVNNPLLNLLPIAEAEFVLTDPSTADLTGRTLEFLGNYTNLAKNHHAIKNSVNWLLQHQEKNGSWYGRWGICYIYGTWAAITGLTAVGVEPHIPSIKKALDWLRNIQNADGGWGESCKSDIHKIYTPLGASTITHTAWALDALISASEKPTPEINRGITFLLQSANKDDWTTAYPVGQGLAGSFYMHYHSYRYIFPLLALSHYLKKF